MMIIIIIIIIIVIINIIFTIYTSGIPQLIRRSSRLAIQSSRSLSKCHSLSLTAVLPKTTLNQHFTLWLCFYGSSHIFKYCEMEFNIVNNQEQIWSVAFGWHIVRVLALCQRLPGICVCSVALQQHGSCWWPRGPAVSSSYLCLCMRWFSHVLALCWWYNSMASSSMRKASRCFSHYLPLFAFVQGFFFVCYICSHIYLFIFVSLFSLPLSLLALM